MKKTIIGAAALAALSLAVVPAQAAKMSGCSSDNLMKTESGIDTMADGPNKMAAQKEMAAAQDAMLSGKMGACGMHLTKAMQAETTK